MDQIAFSGVSAPPRAMEASRILPAWALVTMNRWRQPPSPWVSIDDDLEHRRVAFYRLYCADDPNVSAMWAELDESLACDERAAFIHTVILAADAIIKDEPLPVYSLPSPPGPRLRTKTQRLARKFAEQVQLLRVCTPPRCEAKETVSSWAGVMVESLVVYFNIGETYQDHDQRWRVARLGIEYTTSSKRGWVQHRRASDVIRRKVIELGFSLISEIEISGAQLHFAEELKRFVSDLRRLPDFKTEHGADLALDSQKSGYLDWFRHAYRETMHSSKVADQSPLCYAGWSTLASIVTGESDITRDDIAHAARVWQKT